MSVAVLSVVTAFKRTIVDLCAIMLRTNIHTYHYDVRLHHYGVLAHHTLDQRHRYLGQDGQILDIVHLSYLLLAS